VEQDVAVPEHEIQRLSGQGRHTAWHKVAELDELPDGRVKTVVAGHRSMALTRYGGRYGALVKGATRGSAPYQALLPLQRSSRRTATISP